MSATPASSCPDWCDPRTHIDHDSESPEHRSAGLLWKPVAGDTELTVRTIRLDSTEDNRLDFIGTAYVNLRVVDLAPIEESTAAETDLDPADARMLAAALICEAERVEALQRRSAVTR